MLRFKLKSLHNAKIRGPGFILAQRFPTSDPRAYFRRSATSMIRFHCFHLKFDSRKYKFYIIKVVQRNFSKWSVKRYGNIKVTMETFVDEACPPVYPARSSLRCRGGFRFQILFEHGFRRKVFCPTELNGYKRSTDGRG